MKDDSLRRQNFPTHRLNIPESWMEHFTSVVPFWALSVVCKEGITAKRSQDSLRLAAYSLQNKPTWLRPRLIDDPQAVKEWARSSGIGYLKREMSGLARCPKHQRREFLYSNLGSKQGLREQLHLHTEKLKRIKASIDSVSSRQGAEWDRNDHPILDRLVLSILDWLDFTHHPLVRLGENHPRKTNQNVSSKPTLSLVVNASSAARVRRSVLTLRYSFDFDMPFFFRGDVGYKGVFSGWEIWLERLNRGRLPHEGRSLQWRDHPRTLTLTRSFHLLYS